MATELDPSDSMGALYGTRLRRYRLEAGWTQYWLSRKVHVVSTRKRPTGPALAIPDAAWTAFIGDLEAGSR
jgi:hypothetical protein